MFHATSAILHLSSSYLVYKLARRLFGGNGPAVLSGAVFLLNPLQLEAVLWISGLQELLWVFFLLAAMTAYLGDRVLSPRRLMVTLCLVGLALLSKETAVCYLLLLPAADWAFFSKRGKWLPFGYALFLTELVAHVTVRGQFVAASKRRTSSARPCIFSSS